MLDALIQHQANAYRASTAVVNELNKQFTTSSNALVSELRDILDDLTNSEKAALTAGKYTTTRLKDFKSAFDVWYQSIAVTLPELFLASSATYAAYEVAFISGLYGGAVESNADDIVKAFKSTPIAGGALFNDLFSDLAESTRKQALYAVRSGIQSGLSNQEIIAELRGKRTKVGDSYEYVGGIVEQAKNKIEANVRTARSALANTAYNDTFTALGYEYVKFISTLDGRTTLICSSLSNNVYKMSEPHPAPPLHFRCRSILVGVNKDGKLEGKRPFVASDKPVSKIPKDQREGVVGQVDANVGFKEWFARQDSSFQEKWLGKKRYQLYKSGGYSIEKFIDPLGEKYTLDELRELDEALFKKLGI